MDIAVDIGMARPKRPVWLDVARLHAAPAAELLRPGLDDMILVRPARLKLKRLFDFVLMASGKSAYLSEKVKNEVLGAVAFGAPANTYWGLWTTAAATDMDAYVGNTAGEVASTGSYDRVTKANNTTNFASISGDAPKVNSNAITWATATGNWNSSAVIPQLAVFDGNAKSAADNLLVWGDFTTAKAVLNGDTAQINTSAFSWTEE
jgi:hypothetical protein